MARVADAPCAECGTNKVAMRNMRGAPFLGCPKCHADEEETLPQPSPAPAPQPTPEPPAPKKRSWFGGYFDLARED